MKSFSVNRAWAFFFGFWALLLTGMFEPTIQSPGLKQWIRVKTALQAKRQDIADTEARSELLQVIAEQLESNPYAQEREIRKVLGFLGDQEVVFDFSP
jgi:hypothetical protein